MRKNMKNGISLIVLVITIIVMIILAAAIIISLNNTGIIGAAENAVCKTNIKQAQNLAVLKWSELYIDGERDTEVIKEEIIKEFNKNKLNADDYNIEVTTGGVEVSSKAGCVDSSGVEGGNGGSDEEVIDPNWVYAYIYTEADGWSERVAKTDVGSEVTGKIVARFYETGATVDAGNAYKMVIQGAGEIMVYSGDMDEYLAWQKDRDEETENDLSQNVTEVVIGKRITTIGAYSFMSFSELANVTIHSDVRTIGEQAFEETGLKSIEIPEGVTTIEGYAFAVCKSLSTVVLPKSLTSIGRNIFKYSYNVDNIYYRGTEQEWSVISGNTGISGDGITRTVTYEYTEN